MLRVLLLVVIAHVLSGCAYQFGYSDRSLPGGYQKVAIPVFENGTDTVGLEVYFTNAIRRQFARSRVAKVANPKDAHVELIGKIISVTYGHGGQVEGTEEGEDTQILLPTGTVLTTEYRVVVVVQLILRRIDNKSELWKGDFKDELVYSAPQIGLPVVNSVNPIYNHSARQQLISKMATNLMAEAHDQMTENF